MNTPVPSCVKTRQSAYEAGSTEQLFARVTVFVALNGTQTAVLLSVVAVVREMTHEAKLAEVASQF